MPTNDFKAFATGVGANVIDQSTYAALATLIGNGFSSGIADSQQLNKVWRQGTAMAAALGAFINAQGYDALDNGDTTTLAANFLAAMQSLVLSTSPKTMLYCGTSGGTANAQTLTPSPAITSYGTGVPTYIMVAGYTNTGALTLNISGLGVKEVRKDSPSGLVPLTGSEVRATSMCTLRYDGTYFRLEDSQLGSAALMNASVSTPGGVVASVSGTTTSGRVATFSDANGTIRDEGVDLSALAPLASPTFTGTPSSPTPAQFNSTTKIATTAFVQRASGNFSGVLGVTGTSTLAITNLGKLLLADGPTTLTLPAANVVLEGSCVTIKNSNNSTEVTIITTGTDKIAIDHAGNVLSSVTLWPDEDIVLVSNGSDTWFSPGGSYTEALAGKIRRRCYAALTIYVSPTGSDSADGLTAATPKATIPAAIEWVMGAVDCAGHMVTIKLADGTYTGGVGLYQRPVGCPVNGLIIEGNLATPSSTVISTTNTTINCVSGHVVLRAVKLVSAGSSAIQVQGSGIVYIDNGVNFGACSQYHMYVGLGGSVVQVAGAAYSISGGALYHYGCTGGTISFTGGTVAMTGTLVFTAFSFCTAGVISTYGQSFTGGTITGYRYKAAGVGYIFTNAGGASYYPGSVAGVVTNSGVYG